MLRSLRTILKLIASPRMWDGNNQLGRECSAVRETASLSKCTKLRRFVNDDMDKTPFETEFQGLASWSIETRHFPRIAFVPGKLRGVKWRKGQRPTQSDGLALFKEMLTVRSTTSCAEYILPCSYQEIRMLLCGKEALSTTE